MRIGMVFPQTELGGDAGAVRAWALRAGELGSTHVPAYDHVVGADPAVYLGWDGPYDVHTTFHEPMVLYGYLAAVTSVELVTGVVILAQRQTVLVAKQAAEVDLLTGGKFRLGAGIGWNRVEYEALGQDFGTRGQRLAEQITLLRRLWTEQTVTFAGTFDQIAGPGLAPMPVQRPIPVWVRRSVAARLAPGRAAGSRRWPRARSCRRPARSRPRPPRRPAVTRPASAWKGTCAGSRTGTSWRRRCGSGRTRAPRTCRSTP
jgi:probable F420-dependent oxidoreductase